MFLILLIYREDGTWECWRPGVVNDPQSGHRYVDSPYGHTLFDEHFGPEQLITRLKLEWDEPVPEEILASKPLYWLIQMLDRSRARIGFRARPENAWHLSRPFNLTEFMKGEFKKFDVHCWGTVTGRHLGQPAGSPMYQKLLVDYVHYRYGLTTE